MRKFQPALFSRRGAGHPKISLFLVLLVSTGFTVEPNKIKTTIHKIGMVSGTSVQKDLVSVTYSDGLGRELEQKVLLDDTKDRVTRTFFDEIGRSNIVTKNFIDREKNGSFLEYDLDKLNAPATGPLRLQYNDANAFSSTKYWTDPLNRVSEQNGPGASYSTNASKTWYCGVSDEATRTISFTDGGTSYSVVFEKGFITTTLTDALLTAIVKRLLDQDDFNCIGCPGANHFLTVTKDAKGNYTQELKDVFGKTVGTRVVASGSEIKSIYTYDICGNLKIEEAPKSGTAEITNTVYDYNRLNQLIAKVTPDGGAFEYKYTKTGQLEYVTSYFMDGMVKHVLRTINYTYDDFDRPASTGVLNNGVYDPVVRNYYDSPGNIPEDDVNKYNLPVEALSQMENVRGRLVASVAVNRIATEVYYVSDLYSYDDEGRISRKIKVIPGLPPQTTAFYYDIQGKVVSEIITCGEEQIIRNYTYDTKGRRETIAQKDINLVTYNYDDLNRLDYKDLATTVGHRVDYSFNIREWVESIASPAGAVNRFSETVHLFEPNGNILSATYGYNYTGAASPLDVRMTYAYDEANRLTNVYTAFYNYVSEYGYDPIGRFTHKKEGTKTLPDYQYYDGTNRLRNTALSSSDKKYMYDKHGNQVVDISKNMIVEYDWRDMPVGFRFYNKIPTEIRAKTDGLYEISDDQKDLYKFMAKKVAESSPTITLLSQVIMLYDASGNRVYKLEGK